MLTNTQIFSIAEKMNMKDKIVDCLYKDKLSDINFEEDKAYIINLQDSPTKDEDLNGTHFTLLYSQTFTKDDVIEYVYFDPTGIPPPQEVLQFVGKSQIPYTIKNIQGKYNQSCGWYCLAFLYYLTTFPLRTTYLYTDVENFLSLFEDNLDEKIDLMKNELVLQSFFKETPITEELKGEVDVNSIVNENRFLEHL